MPLAVLESASCSTFQLGVMLVTFMLNSTSGKKLLLDPKEEEIKKLD